MVGLTFDTGALIALEAREARMTRVFSVAQRNGVLVTVPTVVVAQWWRGQRGPAARLLRTFRVEPLDEALARLTGKALAITGSTDIVDAVVVASAASRGDVVYTSDVDDLQRLAERVFPEVRILHV